MVPLIHTQNYSTSVNLYSKVTNYKNNEKNKGVNLVRETIAYFIDASIMHVYGH